MSSTTTPHRLIQALMLSAGLLAASAAQASLLLSDAVESSSGWVAPTVGYNSLVWLGGCCGTAPTAGAMYMHVQNQGGRLATNTYTGFNLQAGHYVVTFDIGSFDNAPLSTFDAIGLTAGGNLLAATTSSKPTPANSTVSTWTLGYDISAADAALGQTLGFKLSALNTGASANASFDNLKIDFVAATAVPEPSTLLLLAAAGVAATCSRRRAQTAA